MKSGARRGAPECRDRHGAASSVGVGTRAGVTTTTTTDGGMSRDAAVSEIKKKKKAEAGADGEALELLSSATGNAGCLTLTSMRTSPSILPGRLDPVRHPRPKCHRGRPAPSSSHRGVCPLRAQAGPGNVPAQQGHHTQGRPGRQGGRRERVRRLCRLLPARQQAMVAPPGPHRAVGRRPPQPPRDCLRGPG